MGSVMTVTSPAPWPLQTWFELAAHPTVPGVVRGHVRAMAGEWGLAVLAETAELVASELATNAVQASQRPNVRADLAIVPVVRLWLTSDGTSMVIHIWDASDDMPVRQDTTADEEGGRGLLLVGALAKDWGTYRKLGGKVVWGHDHSGRSMRPGPRVRVAPGHVRVAPGPRAEAQNYSDGEWVGAGAVGPQDWLHLLERIQR